MNKKQNIKEYSFSEEMKMNTNKVSYLLANFHSIMKITNNSNFCA